jgi:D-sedoheptulose 7-phosphate isomerase
MSSEPLFSLQAGPTPEVLDLAFRRAVAGARLVDQAGAIADLCHDMAARFHRRGKLLVFGEGASSADAQNVTVSFLHPILPGKPSLPAVCLATDAAALTGAGAREGWPEIFAGPMRQLARPADIAMAISARREPLSVRRGLEAARERGLLTVSLVGEGDGASSVSVDHRVVAASSDLLIARELQVTVCHLVWELVHVFLEHPATLARNAT